MKPTITAREHYERLAELGHGRNDPPGLLAYMARWDGPPFFDALGNIDGKDVLEVGVGFGRVARQVLKRGCRSLTGLDFSPKTIAAATSDLSGFSNLELVLADITSFSRPDRFDVAYSVLTFVHVQDKRKALQNVVDSVRPGGRIVLSLDNAPGSLDFGDWTVTLHPWPPKRYAETLRSIGCEIDNVIPLIDTWVNPKGQKSGTYGERVATVVKATRT